MRSLSVMPVVPLEEAYRHEHCCGIVTRRQCQRTEILHQLRYGSISNCDGPKNENQPNTRFIKGRVAPAQIDAKNDAVSNMRSLDVVYDRILLFMVSPLVIRHTTCRGCLQAGG